jgi:hypothetical protein
MIRPLKDLLLEADKFLSNDSSLSKTAGPVEGYSSEITSLVDSCLSASEVILTGAVRAAPKESFSDYEKLAMAVNRVHAHAFAEELQKTAQFAERAESAGYVDYQIDEALSKVAAKKIKDMLPILVGLEATPLPQTSAESKPKVVSKQLPNKDKLKDASKAVGE